MGSCIFSPSGIERDPEKVGGDRVITRIFGDFIDFSGIVETDKEENFRLVADIVPDQSRIFSKLTVRLDGLEYHDFLVRKREDGMKVVSISIPLSPNYKEECKEIELVWNYSDEDLARPDIFQSTVQLSFGTSEAIHYDEETEVNGIHVFKGAYQVKEGDYLKQLVDLLLDVMPLEGKTITGLKIREYYDFPDNLSKSVLTDYSNQLGDYPLKVRSSIGVGCDTLKVEQKKLELQWKTPEGVTTEEFIFETKTLGYGNGFKAPIPICLREDAYPEVNFVPIYKNIICEPSIKINYKGNEELKGKNLHFFARCPIELGTASLIVHPIVNGTEVSFQQSSRMDDNYNYTDYSVDLAGVDVESLILKCVAHFPAGDIEYTVDFTELF